MAVWYGDGEARIIKTSIIRLSVRAAGKMAKGTRGRISRGEQGSIVPALPNRNRRVTPLPSPSLASTSICCWWCVKLTANKRGITGGTKTAPPVGSAETLAEPIPDLSPAEPVGSPPPRERRPARRYAAARAEKAASERETEPRQAVIPARRGARDEP